MVAERLGYCMVNRRFSMRGCEVHPASPCEVDGDLEGGLRRDGPQRLQRLGLRADL